MRTSLEAFGKVPAHEARMMRAPDGVSVAVQDWGGAQSAARAVLFIHGFSQSHLCWWHQIHSALNGRYRLVTYDARGHGDSDKPITPDFYRDSRRWADELHAVLRGLQLDRPFVVAWSYGGRMILDYLLRYGDGAIGGLVLVAATSSSKPEYLGPAAPLLARMGSETTAAARLATVRFLRACTAQPLAAEDVAFMMAYNQRTPPLVRRLLMGRVADYDAVLRQLRVPLLTVHGAEDPVSRPAMSDHTIECAGHGDNLIYPLAGHLPFWEESERFNADLDTFFGLNAR